MADRWRSAIGGVGPIAAGERFLAGAYRGYVVIAMRETTTGALDAHSSFEIGQSFVELVEGHVCGTPGSGILSGMHVPVVHVSPISRGARCTANSAVIPVAAVALN